MLDRTPGWTNQSNLRASERRVPLREEALARPSYSATTLLLSVGTEKGQKLRGLGSPGLTTEDLSVEHAQFILAEEGPAGIRVAAATRGHLSVEAAKAMWFSAVKARSPTSAE